MRLMMLGCPGAGKGTQAQFISQRYGIPQISTGEMLRQAVSEGSPLGVEVKHIMESGKLVPDNVMIQLVKERIKAPDCKEGFILDGFPRTIPQADALVEQGILLDYVVEIHVSDEEIVKRMSGRLTHPASGRVYHRLYNPPKTAGLDDITQEPLIQREDDKEETVRKRLSVYHSQTKPLVDYYAAYRERHGGAGPVYRKISGVGAVEDVKQQLFNILDNKD